MTKHYTVTAIGNALVDILSPVSDDFFIQQNIKKGSMILMDAEQAQNIYESMGQTRFVSGGSAANSIAALASLKIKTAFIGSLAEDEMGKHFAQDLKAIGSDLKAYYHKDQQNSGRSHILVSDDAERTMCTFLGCAGNIPQEALSEDIVEQSEIFYVEGYLWDQEKTKETIRTALKKAKAAHTKTAFTLSDVFCVENNRQDFLELIKNDFDIVFANEAEIKSLFEVSHFNEALQKAASLNIVFALTRGEKGAVIVSNGQIDIIDAVSPDQLVDTTGAGDSFAAGFLYGISQNMSFYDSGVMGANLSSDIISHYGARSVNDLSRYLADFKKAS